MLYTVFPLTIRITLLFVALLLLIRAQPYDDSPLRAFLIPQGCPAPCWMGIRPAVTTLESSHDILGQNTQIGTITTISPATLRLKFVGDSVAVREAQLNLWSDEGGLIRQIEVLETRLTMSEVVLALGDPERLVLQDTIHSGTSRLTAEYPQYGLSVSAAVAPCVIRQAAFWMASDNLTVTFGQGQAVGRSYLAYDPALHQLDPHHWAAQLREVRSCP